MKKASVLCVVVLISSLYGFAQRLPEVAVPEHYALTLQPDLETNKFTGDEVIDVRVVKPTNVISLNAADITFEQVTLSSAGKTQTAQVKIDADGQMATLSVPQQVSAGPAQIHIRYTGELNDKLRGFYRATANGQKYAVTQFEPTDARRAFPSFDEPAYKATFDITVIAPQDDMVISNGKVISDTKGPRAGLHTVKFATTPKMSTYLVAVLVGRFECLSGSADDIPIRVCAPPGEQQLGEFALKWTEDILKFYNRYYSIKYPYGKLDQVAIPDFEAGAMENTGAITYRDEALLVDPKTATTDHQKSVASVIAHEMAHQWFGDLVTMKWWDDIWLNEGFATWMASKPLAALKPEWGVPQDEEASAIHAMRIDSLKSTRAIRTNVATTAQINELFDEIAYNKTAAVLRMVEGYISPEVFRTGVNQYLQAHAYGNAAAEDFWTKMAQASGKPVDRIMKSFVDQPGLPMVEMSGCANGQATLSQRRFYYNPDQKTADQAWTVPVCTKQEGAIRGDCLLLTQTSQQVKVSTCGSATNENAGAGYYRSAYSPQQITAVAPVLTQSFTPPERLSLLANEWALVRRGQHKIAAYLELADGMASDRTHGVWDELARALQTLDEDLATNADRSSYQAWVRKFATPVMEQLGWSARPGDDYETRSVRADAFLILGYTGQDPKAVEEAKKTVRQYIKDPASTDPMLSEHAFAIAAKSGDAALYNDMKSAMAKASTPDVYYRYMNALTEFTDPALVTRTLDWATSQDVRTQDMPVVFLQLLTNPAAQRSTWDYVRSHWDQVSERASYWGMPLMIRGAGAFCDPEMRKQLSDFFTQHKVPQAERTLQQTLEQIDGCMQFKAAQQANLAAWLTNEAGVRGQ